MVKKAKSPKPAKLKASSKGGLVKTAVGVGASMLGIGGKGKGGKRSKKKSALWYAKEIQRIKLKNRYNKIKLGMMR